MNEKKTNKNHINSNNDDNISNTSWTNIAHFDSSRHLFSIDTAYALFNAHLFGFVFLIWSKWISLKLKLHPFYRIFPPSPPHSSRCSPEWAEFFDKSNAFKLQFLSHSFFPTEWNKIMGCEDYHALKRDIINEHTHTKYIYFILFIYLCDAWRLRNGCFIIGTHHRCNQHFFLLSFTTDE